MKKSNNSLDGFVPRRADDGLGEMRFQSKTSKKSHTNSGMRKKTDRMARPMLKTDTKQVRKPLGKTSTKHSINTKDITESLRMIDDGIDEPKRPRSKVRKIRGMRPKKKPWRKVLIVLGAILLIVGGYLGIKFILNSNKIFSGGMMGLVQQKKLKEDENGRTNVLIYGTSPADHDGANLTDSIMVLSINQTTKHGIMVSLPRDLWVKYSSACSIGGAGKLNAAYFCASKDGKDENAGAKALEGQVKNVLGLDTHYFAHVDWDVLTQSVDAVGGVDVTIETDDPRGILDRNFDWQCGYRCYYVKYKNGENVHLDGEHALALARARGAAGGYGLSGGNFDREKNQQKIIKALQEKALSAGTLTNVGKVTSLMDALGDNLRTNIDTSELRTALNVIANINSDNLVSLSLVDKKDPLVTTSNISGQSVVIPVAGLYNYSQIHAYIKKNSIVNDVSLEGASIAVYNATGQAGLAKETGESLGNAGFDVTYLGDAPSADFDKIVIYQTKGDKDKFIKTREALEKRYNVSVQYKKPNLSVKDDIDFVIILGDVPTSSTGQTRN